MDIPANVNTLYNIHCTINPDMTCQMYYPYNTCMHTVYQWYTVWYTQLYSKHNKETNQITSYSTNYTPAHSMLTIQSCTITIEVPGEPVMNSNTLFTSTGYEVECVSTFMCQTTQLDMYTLPIFTVYLCRHQDLHKVWQWSIELLDWAGSPSKDHITSSLKTEIGSFIALSM